MDKLHLNRLSSNLKYLIVHRRIFIQDRECCAHFVAGLTMRIYSNTAIQSEVDDGKRQKRLSLYF